MPLIATLSGQSGDQLSLVTSDQVPVPVILTPGTSGPVDASAVTYTPGDPNVWPLPPPATVAAALDLLASITADFRTNAARVPVAGETDQGTIGPFANVPVKSGVYLAWAVLELVIPSAPVAQVAEIGIFVDTVSQVQAIGSGYTIGASTHTLSQLALVTVNRAASHSWEVRWFTNDPTAPGHVDVQSAKLLLLEL